MRGLILKIEVRIQDSLEEKLGLKYDEVINQALNELTSQAKANLELEVPVDTGRLQSSITSNTSGDLVKEITCSAPYWVYVNYGTYKMPANPFIDRVVSNLNTNGILTNALKSKGIK